MAGAPASTSSENAVGWPFVSVEGERPFVPQTMRRGRLSVALRLDTARGHQSGQMGDDAAALRALGQSASEASCADQSLLAATASGGSGSAEGRTSGKLKLLAGDSSPEDPNPAREESQNRTAIQEELDSNLEIATLRLELGQLRQTLEEQGEEEDEAGARDNEEVTAADDGEEDLDTVEYRVVEVDGGTYRGQVRLRAHNEWQPHGLGVLTTVAGHACCGQWINGKQVGHGTRYSPTLQYEGDFGNDTMSTASRYGVGLYTFGALFVGCWSRDLHPHGLGSLQKDTKSVDGWFHGLRCAHQYPFDVHDTCIFKLSSSVRSQSQPLRGLLVADEKLQYWRKSALVRAMSTWTRLCCEFSTDKARRTRLLALKTHAEARRAEQQAISDDLQQQKTERSQDAGELLGLLAESREAQKQRMQRRQLYAQRLASAIKQRDLARACVDKQDCAVKALELELQEIVELLKEAQQAQEDCTRYASELHVLKRQIENASVKLNAAHVDHRQRNDIDISPRELESQAILSCRSGPTTPLKKTPRQRQDAELIPQNRRGSTYPNVTLSQKFVCDVSGCTCGIPRDVFLRVAAALNDE